MSLVEQVRRAGVVGAGGAGFPAHVKVGAQAEYVIANGAECEPLMHKDAELMALHAAKIIAGVEAIMDAIGASKGIIGVKGKHEDVVEIFTRLLESNRIDLHILGDFYPTGDEFVLVYETTGRLIPPGGIPLDVGVVVQYVETLYNIDLAREDIPVTQKFLTVAGAVGQPLTCMVPVGVRFREIIELAGGALADDYALLVGGAMMGRLTRDTDECVTKTTGGLIVLPGDHTLIQRKERPEAAMHQIGKSACDQCSYCTELCPRYLLGYAIEPHKVMRSLVFTIAGEGFWNKWGALCCECSLCTLYACPEDLYPREACQRAKQELRTRNTNNSTPIYPEMSEVKAHPMYESRRIPLPQLVRRLGLTAYDLPTPFHDIAVSPSRVRLPLKQHTGAPAQPVVRVGDRVNTGDLVAEIPEDQLGARIHASIDGTIRTIDPEIMIEI